MAGLYIGVVGYILGSILGLYRENGKENGNYYNSALNCLGRASLATTKGWVGCILREGTAREAGRFSESVTRRRLTTQSMVLSKKNQLKKRPHIQPQASPASPTWHMVPALRCQVYT